MSDGAGFEPLHLRNKFRICTSMVLQKHLGWDDISYRFSTYRSVRYLTEVVIALARLATTWKLAVNNQGCVACTGM